MFLGTVQYNFTRPGCTEKWVNFYGLCALRPPQWVHIVCDIKCVKCHVTRKQEDVGD